MKYALVLESNSETCNDTAKLVASIGYLVTPVFNPKKALHAAHMIQFDLIVTCTTTIPGDRRSLTGELARCSPDATLIFVAESELDVQNGQFEGVNAIIKRPVVVEDLKSAIDHGLDRLPPRALPLWATRERRRRAVD
jgi:CheY-like chemotaxis protein